MKRICGWLILRGLARDDGGQALVELAVLMPVLLLLLLGIIEVGRAAHFNSIASSAARAGVQYGQQNLITAADNAGMQTAAVDGANDLPGLTAIATSYCTCADGAAASCQVTACTASHRLVYVQVTASVAVAPLFDYPGVSKSLLVTRSATTQVP